MKRDSRRNKEIGTERVLVSGARLYSSSAELPPFPLCHSFERNDVRSGLFIVVKNTSKCPSSPARDKGQPPLLSSSFHFGSRGDVSVLQPRESGFVDRFSSFHPVVPLI